MEDLSLTLRTYAGIQQLFEDQEHGNDLDGFWEMIFFALKSII